MPSPENLALSIKKNGGAPATGPITAAFSDSIVLSVGATGTGAKRVKYRIYEFPDGFPVPVGWTQESARIYSVTVASGGDAPAFTLPAAGNTLRGKYFFDAVANDGLRNGAPAGDLVSKAQLKIPFTSGLEDIGFLETNEFDSARQTAAPLKLMVRTLDAAILSGGGVTDHGLLTGIGDDDHAQYVPRSGVRGMLAALSLGGFKVTNLGTPTAGTDAATKAYVDATAGFAPSGTPSPGDVVKWNGSAPVWGSSVVYAITGFAASAPTLEVGATATNPAFTAVHSSTPTSLLLTNTDNGESKSVVGTPSAFTSSQSYTKTANNATVPFTITGSDGVSSANRSASIAWRPRVYWGTGAAGLSTEAHIEALASSALQSSRAGSHPANATGSLKIYWAAPASYGTPTFTVGGFSGGFTLVSNTISVTNAFGVTQNYQLWESDTPGLGNTSFTVS